MNYNLGLLRLRERFLILIFLILVMLFSSKLQAQVTIGSNEKANLGALLDIKESGGVGANSTKGVLLPRVKLVAKATLAPENPADPATPPFVGDEVHVGLWVYNLTDNTGYSMRNSNDMLCPGPYVWNKEEWVRLWPACLCEYTVVGRNGQEYSLLCNDFENVPYDEAQNVCKTINAKYSYHLMTYDEYEQMWSQPVSENGSITSDFSFTPGVQFFIHKKSDISFPQGWITIGFQSDANNREVLGWNRGSVSSHVSGYFPGGTPVGALHSKATVRCVKDY